MIYKPFQPIALMMRTLLLVLTLVLLGGCSEPTPCGDSKDDFLKNYYELINEASAANLPVSDKQWSQYDERFRAYVEECYEQHESELSPKERRNFWARSMKYFAQRYGDGAIRELGKGKHKASEKVREEVEKICEDTK